MDRRLNSGAGANTGVSFARLLAGLAAATVLAIGGCARDGADVPLVAFPAEPSGQLNIIYPFDEALFPPDIAPPTFKWSDKTTGAVEWTVLVRYGDDNVERFATGEPSWQPSAAQWASMKQRTMSAEAQVAVVGLGADAVPLSSASVRISTSTDPVGDSVFYREVPLPFIAAVQDPSRIRWRFGSVDSEAQPPVVLEDLPVCGNCHSFSDDGATLGLDVDYGNDKGGYAILPVSEQMVLNEEKIIT
ncbi:MAG: hypothetical protein AAFN78_19155, partial [Pseudomonadota bacterium]